MRSSRRKMAASIHRLTSLLHKTLHYRGSPVRSFRCAAAMFGARDAEFEAAQNNVQKLSQRPDNSTMLQLYSLYKQASSGPCNAPKPGALDFVGKAKWNAWKELGDISQDDAQTRYIDLVSELTVADGGAATSGGSATNGGSADVSGDYTCIKVNVDNNLYSITLNRPDKKNALTREMYREVMSALKDAANNDKITLATITGSGDFYCSGNDLGNFSNIDPSSIAQHAKDGKELLLEFVASFIDFPKPLVALVNGPAIGVAATTLGLCDVVYATSKATFQTPMVALGQSPEGASSVIFPKIMGLSRANEMLLFGRQISAQTACDWGLVTEVFPDHSFTSDVTSRVAQLASLPPQSLRYSKLLMRGVDVSALHAANKAECERLEERWQSDECFTAIMNFFSKKAKL